MFPFLAKRASNLTEWMDQPDADLEYLNNTYRQFDTINRLLSGWRAIYKAQIRPVLKSSAEPVRILDIGCGGGDILFFLCDLCRKDGFDVLLTGIDPDARSIAFARERVAERQGQGGMIRFLHQTAEQHARHEQGILNERDDGTALGDLSLYDFVISNHVIHHLDEAELVGLAKTARSMTRHMVIFNDISRSVLGYALFHLTAPLIFRRSFIHQDGLISIRRSYRPEELEKVLGESWDVCAMFPFRLLAFSKGGTSLHQARCG